MEILKKIIKTLNNENSMILQELANETNGMKNKLQIAEGKISKLEADVSMLKQCILDMHERVEISDAFPSRAVRKQEEYSLELCYSKLKKLAPNAFDIYMKLMAANDDAYQGEPIHSCSVEGHAEAANFCKFVKRYVHGNVLDIGCGPQSVPLYLAFYDKEKLYGMDPLPPDSEHPFEFVRGISEFIPWEDDSFDCIVFATSLDHVLLVNKVWEEVYRTLKKDGYVLIWQGFDENAPAYNPYSDAVRAYDSYHMFHYTRDGFESEMKSFGFEMQEYYGSGNTHFYAYKKR